METKMETTILGPRDDGKENANYTVISDLGLGVNHQVLGNTWRSSGKF